MSTQIRRKETMQWSDVSPFVKRVYKRYLNTDDMQWMRSIWPYLVQDGLASGRTTLDRLDTTVRALSLGHLHIMFCHEFSGKRFEPEYKHVLRSALSPKALGKLAIKRYGASKSDFDRLTHCLDCAFNCVHSDHIAQGLIVLRQHVGSVEDIYQHILKHTVFKLEWCDNGQYYPRAAFSFLAKTEAHLLPDGPLM